MRIHYSRNIIQMGYISIRITDLSLPGRLPWALVIWMASLGLVVIGFQLSYRTALSFDFQTQKVSKGSCGGGTWEN